MGSKNGKKTKKSNKHKNITTPAEDKTKIKVILLDIEGTVCPISFVREELFPFFLAELPSITKNLDYPITDSSVSQDTKVQLYLDVIKKFPSDTLQSSDSLLKHINDMVQNDIKDPVLKKLQGLVWEIGYDSGKITAPLYQDSIRAIERWSQRLRSDQPSDSEEGRWGVYIYSSGSIQAQKLLFGNVRSDGGIAKIDLNSLLNDYFDTTNAGSKITAASYKKISKKIGIPTDRFLFLTDNVNEVQAATDAGMHSAIVQRPGNEPLSQEILDSYNVLDDGFDDLP